LLSATDEDGRPLSDQAIRTELIGLAIGGTHTTSISMSWVFDCLLHDRETRAPGRRSR
jgi:cytochrome P450